MLEHVLLPSLPFPLTSTWGATGKGAGCEQSLFTVEAQASLLVIHTAHPIEINGTHSMVFNCH